VLIQPRDAETSNTRLRRGKPDMSTLHSLLENAAAAGSLYGWRMDAILLGSMLWALTAGSAQLRLAISH
jgi:hypothetical protein